MSDRVKQLQRRVREDLENARELALLRAFARSHGVDEVVVPVEVRREVAEADRAVIRDRRAGADRTAWLHHERDAVCVELGLTRTQVAHVLTMQNRADPAASARKSRASRSASRRAWPPVRLRVATASDPTGRLQPVEDADRKVVLAARKAIPLADKAAWRAFVEQYGVHRLLTSQQIAGIVAVARRTGQLAA